MTDDRQTEATGSAPKRPLAPTTGAAIFFGSLAVCAALTYALSLFLPLSAQTLARYPVPITNQGAWLMLGAWLLYPMVLGAFFLRLAKGVDPMRLAWAYAGVVYFLQSWAELTATDEISLWPELLLSGVGAILLYKLLPKEAPAEEGSQGQTS